MTYRAPINDMLLALNHGAGLQAAVKAGHYGDFDADITAAVLEEAGRFASDVLAPLNRVGDENGIKLDRRQGDHRAGLARCLQALDRGRLERGIGPGSVRRPGPAARDQCRLHRNLERIEHGVRPLPAADAERDRGARCAWQRRTEEDLSRKAGLRRVDRHHAADRAAGRIGCRRAAHPRRTRGRRQLSHFRHEDLHHLWRSRHDRQHRAFRAGAIARCARGHQRHFAVSDSEIPGQSPTARSARATTFMPAASSTSSAFMPRRPAP